MVGNLVSLLS